VTVTVDDPPQDEAAPRAASVVFQDRADSAVASRRAARFRGSRRLKHVPSRICSAMSWLYTREVKPPGKVAAWLVARIKILTLFLRN
jgi:hypothetical protein